MPNFTLPKPNDPPLRSLDAVKARADILKWLEDMAKENPQATLQELDEWLKERVDI